MSDRFREAITKAWNRLEERQWILGRMGRVNPSGSVTFDVPGRKGFVYVRVRNSLGAQSTVPARNDGAVPHTANLPVKMKLENGVYVIHSRTSRADLNEEPATPPSGVFSHPLGEHSNVDFSTPVDGYVVTWSESLGMYILTEPTGGDIAGEIEGATEQTVPEDTNKIALTDDDGLGGRILKWMSWANVKVALSSLYLLVAGKSGGQTAYGGTGASETLTLEGTSHATKGAVALNPNGGSVGVGTSSPGVDIVGTTDFLYPTYTVFQVSGAQPRQVVRGTSNAAFDFIHSGGPTDGKWFVLQNDNGIVRFLAVNDAATSSIGIMFFDLLTGFVGFGTSSPQGKLHSHDGVGGKLFVTKTGIGATAVPVIPNGAGDVLYSCRANYVIRNNSSGTVTGGVSNVANGTEQDLASTGLTLRVNANGSIDLRRTAAGTQTYTIVLDLIWI